MPASLHRSRRQTLDAGRLLREVPKSVDGMKTMRQRTPPASKAALKKAQSWWQLRMVTVVVVVVAVVES